MNMDESNDKYSLLKVQDPMVLYIKGKPWRTLIIDAYMPYYRWFSWKSCRALSRVETITECV